jgi:hypothetical protein
VTQRFVVALLLFAAPACVQTFDATRLGVPASMATPPDAGVSGEAFRVRGSSVHLLFGLFTIAQPRLDRVLAAQLLGGRAVTNLRITVRSRFTDLLVTGLTLGLVVPRTVEFEGVVTDTPELGRD